ncbi:MAG: RagB/SusD family nutrient uptake outer membrane protein [Mediterranea sp.]|jgi:hypothetical protein|nr:RagB/SusD family nutrient uptake outer membrane protein [Mediterranea sp.]
MKTIIKNLILSATLAVGTASCIGLDTAPYDRETDLTYWTEDPEAAIKALNTCYTTLSSMEEQLFSDAATDNAYTKAPNDYTQSIGNGSYSTANSYVLRVWNSRYAGIRACNELLDNIDRVPALSTELKNRYIGEAKVIRAYHYYQLYTRFGDVPYIDHVISIAESQSIARTPKATIEEKILADLDEVITGNYLPASYGADDKGRVTRWAAQAVKAKIYLFDGNWAQTQSVTNTIMNEGGFSLFPSYQGLFEIANEGNQEVILDVQYRPVSREHNLMYFFVPPSLGGYSQLSPLQSLVDSYIMLDGTTITQAGTTYDPNHPYDNRDPRLKATVMYTGNSYTLPDGSEAVIDCDRDGGRDGYGSTSDCTATGYYIKKYWDNTYRLTLQSGLNPILIRYADILLMNAEAHAEQGTLDEAVWNATIKPIRQRAGFTLASALDFPAGASREQLVQTVRNERRSELALEGGRREDIIRWKIAEQVMNGWCHGFYTGDVVSADNGFVRVEERAFRADRHYLWPIPQTERDLNKNLTQNPNW